MKTQYNPEFPERFEGWPLLEKASLSELAEKLAAEAKGQYLLSPEARHLLPGLRFALNRIAEQSSK